MDCVVDSVIAGSPAHQIGLAKGDTIVAVGGKKVETFGDLTDQLNAMSQDLVKGMSHKDSLEILTTTVVARKAQTGLLDTATVTLTPDLKLGYVPKMPTDYKQTHIEYGFFESFPAGGNYGIDVL